MIFLLLSEVAKRIFSDTDERRLAVLRLSRRTLSVMMFLLSPQK